MCGLLPGCILFADYKFKFGCCKKVFELIEDIPEHPAGLEAKPDVNGVDVVVNVGAAPQLEMVR